MEFKEFWTKKTLVALGLGQFLSLLITSTGFTSSELARDGFSPFLLFLFSFIRLSVFGWFIGFIAFKFYFFIDKLLVELHCYVAGRAFSPLFISNLMAES